VLPGAKPAPFPAFIEPCLATLRSRVPNARGFVHELKLDGYRVQAHLHDGRVSLYARTGLDWTTRFPTIAAPRILYSEHFEDGADLYVAGGMHLEGIVSKRADAPYSSGRSQQWFKVKSWKRERFAVVGFVPEGSGGLLKLCLARREDDALVYY